MSVKHKKSLRDLLEVISSEIETHDIVSAMVQSQVCAAITNERIKRDMTQNQFAEFLGVSQGMVSRWESSDYNFTIDTISKIAVKLDLLFSVSLVPNKNTANLSYKHHSSKVIPFPGTQQKYHVDHVDLEEM